MNKKHYNAPALELYALKVERGFAGSPDELGFGGSGRAGNDLDYDSSNDVNL